MKQLKNKKGMTLVEVLVVLLMMSILLVVVGSLILNSFNYFSKTSDQDINKRSLDAISEFVRDELLYANDVRVQDSQPEGENWQVFHVKEGKLFHNNEQLYSEGFYNHKELEIKVRGFDTYRLDLNYSLTESGESKVYSTRDTLELLNVKIVAEADKEFNPFSNISTITTVNEMHKIYYQRGVKPEIDNPTPDDPTQGTVADQIACKNESNDKGKFDPKVTYYNGDFVYIEQDGVKTYYRCVNIEPGIYLEGEVTGFSRIAWKKIDAQYSAQSKYTTGDIVIKDGIYYKCTKDIKYELPENEFSNFWIEISKPTESNKLCDLPGLPSEETEEGTVADQMACLTLHNNRLKFHPNATYRKGDMVFYNKYWWINVSNNKPGTQVPGTLSWYWKKIDGYFDKGSAYEEGDVVIYNNSYYECVYKGGINADGFQSPSDSTTAPGSQLDNTVKLWKKVNQPGAGVVCKSQRIERNENNVIYKLQKLLDGNVFKLEDIPTYDPSEGGNNNDIVPDKGIPTQAKHFVKVKDSELGIYRYYIKMVKGHSEKPGEIVDNKLVWQEMKIDWDEASYYAKGDVVLWAFGNADYMKASETIDTTSSDYKPESINSLWGHLNVGTD